MVTTAWIALFLPLASAFAITLGGSRLSRRNAAWVATLSVAAAFGCTLATFVDMLGRQANDRIVYSEGWTWLTAGNLRFGLTILVDPLAVFMMLIVTGIGALIVAYSIGYMDGENEERRFFAYMSLFVFSMLLLVQAGDLLILLAGWGLVGLSSYLLIGFDQHRPSAIAAAKKAFIMNAVGDATIAISLFLLVLHVGTLNIDEVNTSAVPGGGFQPTWLIIVVLGLLGGAVAKSAQIPLQTWLPDAMEGPTPVSALIHAATMVTAGVYLIVRLSPLFQSVAHVQELAAGLGAATLLMAGLIACVQTDIKRVIAYSTMSQIGYMFLGAGLGAYPNAMFHLMTHAFFKACLFLGAGIVIHALAGEQDMRRMGGLKKLMPLTYLAMLAGGLALVGIPPFSGFFSKDSILSAALSRGTYGVILWIVGIGGVFLTGLYTFRMLFLAFGGEPSEHVKEHPPHQVHEATPRRAMAWTVGVLAVGAVVSGWIQVWDLWTPITNFLAPSATPIAVASGTQEVVTSIFSVAFGLAGIGVAWWVYSAKREAPPKPWRILEKKFYFDELYEALFYRPAVATTKVLYALVEGPFVNGSVTGVSGLTRALGASVRGLQTGLVRTYAFAVAASLAILAIVFLAVK
jgi:NADH-quinone oxidoreductase subunit L